MDQDGQDGPVTVVIRHAVRPGRGAEFEEWLRGITRAAVAFEGYLGSHVVRPADERRPEYLVLLRFDSLECLERWESSETRREWLDRLGPLTARPPARERHTGMEVWFSPPAGRAAPPRLRMAAVTLLTIYPLITLVQTLLAPQLSGWPIALRTLASSALLVCVMTYAAMPLTTRLFSRWLYGRPEG